MREPGNRLPPAPLDDLEASPIPPPASVIPNSDAVPKGPAAIQAVVAKESPTVMPGDSWDRTAGSSPALPAQVAPMVQVRRKVPESARPGQNLPIELTVQNSGPVPVENVRVVDELCEALEWVDATPKPERKGNTLVWNLGMMEPGQQQVIHCTFKVKPNADAKAVRSFATVHFQTSVGSEIPIVNPKLELSVLGPEKGAVGDPVVYLIKVTNQGNAPAAGVVLRDPLPEGLSHPYGPNLENDIGLLPPGDSRKIRLRVTPTKSGKVVNRFTLTADGLEPIEKEVALQVENIELNVTGNTAKLRYLNRPCSFDWTVANQGTVVAKQVQIAVELPPGVTYASASEGGTSQNHGIVWTFPELKPGESKTVTVHGNAMEIGDKTCKALVTAEGNVRKEATVTTKVQGVTALNVEVVDVEDPVEVGGETVFEIHIVNQGTSPATNITVAATLPPEVEALAADGPTTQKLVGNVLNFEPVLTLAPKADVTFRIKAKCVKSGDSRFRVAVTANELSKPVVKEESTTIYGEAR